MPLPPNLQDQPLSGLALHADAELHRQIEQEGGFPIRDDDGKRFRVLTQAIALDDGSWLHTVVPDDA